jgi:hypothetical protein
VPFNLFPAKPHVTPLRRIFYLAAGMRDGNYMQIQIESYLPIAGALPERRIRESIALPSANRLRLAIIHNNLRCQYLKETWLGRESVNL